MIIRALFLGNGLYNREHLISWEWVLQQWVLHSIEMLCTTMSPSFHGKCLYNSKHLISRDWHVWHWVPHFLGLICTIVSTSFPGNILYNSECHIIWELFYVIYTTVSTSFHFLECQYQISTSVHIPEIILFWEKQYIRHIEMKAFFYL